MVIEVVDDDGSIIHKVVMTIVAMIVATIAAPAPAERVVVSQWIPADIGTVVVVSGAIPHAERKRTVAAEVGK